MNEKELAREEQQNKAPQKEAYYVCLQRIFLQVHSN